MHSNSPHSGAYKTRSSSTPPPALAYVLYYTYTTPTTHIHFYNHVAMRFCARGHAPGYTIGIRFAPRFASASLIIIKTRSRRCLNMTLACGIHSCIGNVSERCTGTRATATRYIIATGKCVLAFVFRN